MFHKEKKKFVQIFRVYYDMKILLQNFLLNSCNWCIVIAKKILFQYLGCRKLKCNFKLYRKSLSIQFFNKQLFIYLFVCFRQLYMRY